MARKLRIGVIGASVDGSWAHNAHMPALATLPEIEVVAIATSRADSAARSAAHYGVAKGYADLAQLLAEELDLVAVSVKAPDHARLAEQVLEAGKHLLVEWPMGASLAQSDHLVALANAQGLRGFVALQARAAPSIRHAAALIADGYLGRIHAVSVQGAFPFWGDPVFSAYSADRESGANVLTIPAGHGLDLMRLLAGEVATLNGRTSHLRAQVRAQDTGEMVPMTAPDQVAAIGTLQSGAVFSAHFDGMAPTGQSFRLALNGEHGELVLAGPGMPEIAPLQLSGTREKGAPPAPIAIPQELAEAPFDPAHPAYNIYFLWQQVARDLLEGGNEAPSLASGQATRALLDAIERSAESDSATRPSRSD